MDLLQQLNRDDLQQLAVTFGTGLREDAFVRAMTALLQAKATESPYEFGPALQRWNAPTLRELFKSIDYNQDGTLQYEELTNFAINSALQTSKNQSNRLELQFRDYHLMLPPRPTSYGGTTVINAENFSAMSDQILKGLGHFREQSTQLKRLFYLPGPRRFVAEGFTRITLHAAEHPDPLARLDIKGGLLDVTTAHHHTYLVCATDYNMIEVFEQPNSSHNLAAVALIKRKGLFTDRAVTQFMKSESGLGVLPGWFGGTGDREGLIRYCNMDRLHAQLTLLGHHLDALTISRRKIHTDAITSLHFMNPRFGAETVLSSSLDNRVVLHDVETGVVRFEALHAHSAVVRHVSLSNLHNMGVSIGNENYACLFNLDHKQHAAHRLYDSTDPHPHKLVGVHCVTNSHQVLTADAGGMLKLWDMRTLKCVKSFHVPPLEVDAVSVSLKLKHQRGAGIAEAKPLPPGVRHEVQVTQKCALLHSMVYCDETHRIYALGKETNVFQYDESALLPKAHAEPLVTITYNEVEEQLITASARELKLWNVRNGCCVSSISTLFVDDAGRPKGANVTALAVDHVAGKRVFVGSADGRASCVIPSTGKVEWSVVVRLGAPISHLLFNGERYLYLGFADGYLARIDIVDPRMIPRVYFEPGKSMVSSRSNAASASAGVHDMVSPSSTHYQHQVRRMKSRRSRALTIMTSLRRRTIVPVQERARSNPLPSSVFTLSHALRLIVFFTPNERSIFALELDARSCVVIAPVVTHLVTALQLVRESPLKPKTSSGDGGAVSAAVFPEVVVRGKPKESLGPSSCDLSILAVALNNGCVQLYSLHMAEISSRVTTTPLMNLDMVEGICINTLECVQHSFLVAGCDASAVFVWQLDPLLKAVDKFRTSGTGAAARNNGNGSSPGFGDIVRQATLGRFGSMIAAKHPSIIAPVESDWEVRMAAVRAAAESLQDCLPIGSFALQEQTFVSHCVRIAQSGIVACASGDLDSVVRVVTVDGADIGMLALGRTEEDAVDAANSRKRAHQQVRHDIEEALLRRTTGGSGAAASSQCQPSAPLSPHVLHASDSGDALDVSSKGFAASSGSARTSPQRNESASGGGGVHTTAARSGGKLVSPRRLPGASGTGVSPTNSHRHHTALQPPDELSSQGVGSDDEVYAPYLWDSVTQGREWQVPSMFVLPKLPSGGSLWDETDNNAQPPTTTDEAGDAPAFSATRARRVLVPPALSVGNLATTSQTNILPQLVLDFHRIQHQVSEEHDEDYWEDLRKSDQYDEHHMDKMLRRVNRRIRRLEKRRNGLIEDFEKDCPESVKRLASAAIDEEMERYVKVRDALQNELRALCAVTDHALISLCCDDQVQRHPPPTQSQETDAFGSSATSDPFAKSFSPRALPDEFSATPRLDASMSVLVEGRGRGSGSQSLIHQTRKAPQPASLATLALRRQTTRTRELASQIAGIAVANERSNARRGSVQALAAHGRAGATTVAPQPPVGHRPLREHHTEVQNLAHRLVPYHGPSPPQLRSRDAGRSCVLLQPGVDAASLDDRAVLRSSSSSSPSDLSSDEGRSDSTSADGGDDDYESTASVASSQGGEQRTGASDHQRINRVSWSSQVQPLPRKAEAPQQEQEQMTTAAIAVPPKAGVRHVSPDQFRSNTDFVLAIVQDYRASNNRAHYCGDDARARRHRSKKRDTGTGASSPAEKDSDQQGVEPSGPTTTTTTTRRSTKQRKAVRPLVHGTGEVSTRGVRIKREEDEEAMRRDAKRAKRIEALRKRKLHMSPNELDRLISSPDLRASSPLQSREAFARAHDLVFPPIECERRTLCFPRNTGRTALPIPSSVAGFLRVRQAPMEVHPPLQQPPISPRSVPQTSR